MDILKQYEPFLQAVTELFRPFVEIAVHDLKAGKIVALYNTISRRAVGDASPLEELKITVEKFPPYFKPYYKVNWDGRPLKCTSITLSDDQGTPIALICINTDVSLLYDAQQLIQTFLQVNSDAENPVERFGGPLEDHLNRLTSDYLKQKNISIAQLTRAEKKDLVLYLYQKGIFNFKHAVPGLAKKLKSSRATIYNYIKEL